MTKNTLMVSVCLTALVAGTVATGAAADDRPDLVVAVTKLTPHFDPMGANSNVNERVGENIVENLIRYDWKTGETVPGLATAWKMVDPTTLELTIRDGVACHDGTDFTAEDVEIMFGPQRYGTEDNQGPGYKIAQQFFNTIKAVTALDGNRIRIETYEPDALLINRLSGWMGQVPCADAYLAADGWDAWGQTVIGTGPYRIAENKPGEFHRFEAFGDYWGEPAPAASITYKVVPETAARIAGLISGEYDFITEIQPDQFKTIDDNPGTVIAGGPIRNIRIIVYDTRHPALQDPRVRRALNLAINRELLVEAVFGGKTDVPNGMQVPAFGDIYLEDFQGATYDPDAARALLDAAGYDGTEISYRYLKDYYTGEVSTAQILEQMWGEVGLNVKLELKENWGQIEEDDVAEGRGIVNWSSTVYFNDPIGHSHRIFGPTGFFQVHGFWDGSAFNAAADSGLFSTDLETRRTAFREMLDIFEAEAPGTYLHVLPMYYGKKESIAWESSGTGLMDFRAGALAFE